MKYLITLMLVLFSVKLPAQVKRSPYADSDDRIHTPLPDHNKKNRNFDHQPVIDKKYRRLRRKGNQQNVLIPNKKSV